MNKQVAVILSGCGTEDGSEAREVILTLLGLDQRGIGYRCFAPDGDQPRVVDHRSGEAYDATRNVLREAARLGGRETLDLAALDPDDVDGVVIPGGVGVIHTLSDFATAGTEMSVLPQLRDALVPFHERGKPFGLMGYAPLLVPRLLGEGIAVTVGQNAELAGAISSMGGLHKSCAVNEVAIDREHRVVSTPAFLLAGGPAEASTGIFKLIDRLAEML
ncbi:MULTISPECIES: isoprenoid biosynthesis glyoxalase ElbB [unclassified Modicisalibacter]|uniref:isoprenoid biosynthesis glyoxalase ElbB n=1 Tax=unclassified Modicisalibacter TaxID=2679913 RepID=UPI001CCA28A9|nr:MULTISPECIES: isoprenoid biosynthesis glyoxalase ElbB [unclassified Modicisalibacter]MBZ9558087.1 isoprenoid biosynthesis glyoxalase ElbB [Modicisalibacter sp. R2A 31.J]MBZ9573244.1 isoprenoid biosynthesis glyoxalase ElbB [Modicisalibacter sp. MOD 31.J]